MRGTAMAVSQLDVEEHQPENGFVSPESASPSLLSRIDGCVLPFLGGFGKYQKQLVVLTWIPALFIGFSQFSDSFLLAQPNATCVQWPVNGTETPVSGARSPSSPPPPPPLLLHSAHGHHFHANATRNDTDPTQCEMCTRWTYEMHTGLVQNVVTKWNLVCKSAWKVHIAKFSLLVGSIFGYLVFGVLSDWYGRHPVLITSVFFTLVFGLTVAFSVDVTMFSTLRFFEGFCLAGIMLSLYVLRIELCLPGWRFSMTMVANFVVLAGQLLMPALAAACGDWQVLQAVIICPLLTMLLYIWLFPESLRWLLATQQYSRSKWIIERIGNKNRANLASDELLTELQRVLVKKPKKTCIVKMVGTRNLWKNIVVLCVNSLTGYGIHHCFARSLMDRDGEEISLFHSFYADYYTMAGIAVASCMALCPAVGLMGRRGGLLMFMIITALASLLQLGLLNLLGKYSVQLNIERSDTLKSNFSVAFSIIGMFSSHAVSILSIFFCAEITPTVIRGGGLGLVLASAGFGMLTAPIMELHNQKGYFLHHVIFACCTLICIICILLLPETRYQPLPETLADGESYTRQPLLPPRKLGEQHRLLRRSRSRDYARVGDTPLHAAATTAVSTMESTASSGFDLSLPPDAATAVVADDDVNVNADALELTVIKAGDSDSISPATRLPEAEADAESAPAAAGAGPYRTESLPDIIIDAQSPVSIETPLMSETSKTTPSPALGHTPSPVSSVVNITDVADLVPLSDSNSQTEADSPSNRAPSPSVTDSPAPVCGDAGGHVDSTKPPTDGAAPSHHSDPLVHLPNNVAPPSPSSSSSPLQRLNDAPITDSPRSSAPPPSSSSSPIDSGILLFPSSAPPPPPPTLDCAPLQTPSPSQEPGPFPVPTETATSSLAPETERFTVDLTVSTPIDSGTSSGPDFDGVASS